ncbi:MAG: hypothetical protein IJU70_10700 [Lentisphaeria bacterium]|nr:hypothetical protein [Lentisphaeria bacterium]
MKKSQLVLLALLLVAGVMVFAARSRKGPVFTVTEEAATPAECAETAKFVDDVAKYCRTNNTYRLDRAFLMNRQGRMAAKQESGKDPVLEAVGLLRANLDTLARERKITVFSKHREVRYVRSKAGEKTLKITVVRSGNKLRISEVAAEKI